MISELLQKPDRKNIKENPQIENNDATKGMKEGRNKIQIGIEREIIFNQDCSTFACMCSHYIWQTSSVRSTYLLILFSQLGYIISPWFTKGKQIQIKCIQHIWCTPLYPLIINPLLTYITWFSNSIYATNQENRIFFIKSDILSHQKFFISP